DNFGAMGEMPTHAELLDHLASWFVQHGWSLKALHRYILASAAWQQAGTARARGEALDPGDRLLWRAAPRRLEFEPLRDSLLEVAGHLDRRLGGHSAPLDEKNLRRAVYGYTDRFRIPALLRNFDVANPDTSVSRRAETLVPLQALFLLNNPLVRRQAEALLQRPECARAGDAAERVAALFRLVLSRKPGDDELALAMSFVGSVPLDRSGAERWISFAHGLLLSNEFTFVD
ncbi:MAG TPA: DUF1553 domain-containing protein, partial [Chthoniobacteraceae bacterium]|nr:DUF1553 domain-containing protein [Chthoniobacteraceae bacterium]